MTELNDIKNELLKEKASLLSDNVMKNNSDNMYIWNKVCTTDPGVTKKVEYGVRKFTTICAQFQRKEATKLWGPFGSKWGVKNQKFTLINDKICLYEATFFYPGGEFPIHSDIEVYKKEKYNDDWTKKVATDALTKGLSKLGFNSDVFEGKFDDAKYINELLSQKEIDVEMEVKKTEKNIDKILCLYYDKIEDAKMKEQINSHLNNDEISDKAQEAFLKMLDNKYKNLNFGGFAGK